MSILQEEYPDIMWDGKEKLPLIVSFGAGVDSTAILVNMWKLDITPDHILFADTGAERPDIYAHIERVNKWCDKVNFPQVIQVRHKAKDHGEEGLLGELQRLNSLPSLAFGFKTCSQKHKIAPQHKYIHNELGLLEYINVVGYSSGELDRAVKACQSIADGKIQFYKGERKLLWFPLIDWKLNRDECKKLSKTVGFCTAKSSCFFCPSMKASEVVLLQKYYPEQFKQALELEREFIKREEDRYEKEVADAINIFGVSYPLKSEKEYEEAGVKFPQETQIKGLGRSWNWQKYMDSYSPDLPFMEEFGVDGGCGCTDF